MGREIGNRCEAQSTSLIVGQPEMKCVQFPVRAEFYHSPIVFERLRDAAGVHHETAHLRSGGRGSIVFKRSEIGVDAGNLSEQARPRNHAGEGDTGLQKEFSPILVSTTQVLIPLRRYASTVPRFITLSFVHKNKPTCSGRRSEATLARHSRRGQARGSIAS